MPDDVEDDTYERASRARRARVDRILDLVAASLTEPEQEIFELSVRQGLRGKRLAAGLGMDVAEASRAAYDNRQLAWWGFGAYILAMDGRSHCPDLERILDEYHWDGQHLTRTLRLRILRHLDTCKTCDNCRICNQQKPRFIAPYAPVVIPLLIAAELRDHVAATIRQAASTTTPLSRADHAPRLFRPRCVDP